MSDEIAKQKEEEIAEIKKQDMADLVAMSVDKCPVCKLPTANLEFINAGLVKTFGWVECTICGTVYCPRSVMEQKRLIARSGLVSVGAGEASKFIIE